MKYFILLILCSLSFSYSQITINGVVKDAENNKPLPLTNIIVNDNIGTKTNSKGEFVITVDSSLYKVILLSRVGYNKLEIPINDLIIFSEIKLIPQIITSQTILVESATGNENKYPINYDKIDQKEISRNYILQDVPQYLDKLPSITSYSESGNGVGYNYISIRGFDQRRIAVMINGIPQNEPEDHNVYWLDFPDLLQNTEYIQVQKGAGSGIYGYPAIGGSINIITSAFTNERRFDAGIAIGSFNTRKYNVSFSSGLIDNQYSFYASLSQILSSGYRDNSFSKFNSFHFSAIKFSENLTSQLNIYGGPIEDGLAYTGLPKYYIKNQELRKKNYSDWWYETEDSITAVVRKPTEIEQFYQPHFELLNEFNINKNLTFNSALFLVLGDGFFDYDSYWADSSYLRLTSENGFINNGNPFETIIRAKVENKQWGWIPRIQFNHPSGKLIVGGEFRKHNSIHWGGISYAANLPVGADKNYKYYYYEGAKDILNLFVNETFEITSNLTLLAELQAAYFKYSISNERYLNNEFSIDDIFFNPRAGINYKYNDFSFYLSLARITKEPRLKNYYDAAESSGGATPQFENQEINNFVVYDYSKPLIKPETMNDVELGFIYDNKNFNFSLNAYYMFFENEIVKNGMLDRFGQPITGNMEATIHNGVEIMSTYKFSNSFTISGNLTYGKNYISEGYFYQSEFESINLRGNRLAGFPDLLFNLSLTYNNEYFYIALSGKYGGKFYSDNFDNQIDDNNVNDGYFNSDLFVSVNPFGILNNSKVFLQVNNIFNKLYSANAIGNQFFPAAERNFMAGIKLSL